MTNWNEPNDARTNGGDYPNYYIHKSPSGHVMQLDDTPGAESVTLQHRSGSMIQMHPNGDVVVRAHGVSYNVIFGNKEVFVSGEMNVTVNGGGSLRVEGDYNVTVAGNMNTVVSGNMETVVNGNNNLLVNGDMDTAIDGSQTTKVAGNSEHTSEGKTYIGSHEGLALEATGGNLRVAANDNMNVRVGGTYEAESDGGTTIIGETIDLNP